MPPGSDGALWPLIVAGGGLVERRIAGASGAVTLDGLSRATALDRPAETFADATVLLACRDQLAAALALIELDGIARRLVLVPPDVSGAALQAVARLTEADTVLSSADTDPQIAGVAATARVSADLRPGARVSGTRETEWVLLTSGTTGEPKPVLYTRRILSGAIKPRSETTPRPVWSTHYDIRRYGGLQIFLRAMLSGGSLVLSSASEPVGEFLSRVGAAGVTHMSGTPSHWRRAIMSGAAHRMAPRYVRLSGEIADQAILDALAKTYPDADIAHAFASTEAGVAFDVGDGRAGFPARLVGVAGADVEMKIEHDSLRIRSPRTAIRYLGDKAPPLKDADGFVDTGDMVERVGDRYLFAGRRGGVINVGGAKVYPEEVEAVLNRHPAVEASRVMPKKSAFTGALVMAEVVLRAGATPPEDAELIAFCRETLPAHKVPALVRIVPQLDVTPSGKLVRRNG